MEVFIIVLFIFTSHDVSSDIISQK
jgi:hypothetical protein